MSRIWIICLLAACNDAPPDCSVICTSDADCTDGQTCGELGRCSHGVACPCTAGEFLGCTSDSARFCNAAANGLDTESCGSNGCNADAGRCNECVPDQPSCADANTVRNCGADGLEVSTEACGLGCSESPVAHCAHIVPAFIGNACDSAASGSQYSVTAATSLDTSQDATCNGGIVAQASGLPAICVVRYRTITITATLTVRGSRAIALVADEMLTISSSGWLDASADGMTNGPGGGTIANGGPSGVGLGGGGGGFNGTAGSGGIVGMTYGGGGASGYFVTDPTLEGMLIGGPRQQVGAGGGAGGGGGAVILAACQGTVNVAGVVDVGGGGGGAGFGNGILTNIKHYGGGGGGAGGFVAIEAASVSIAGKWYSNGGGGGGGCDTDFDCVGNVGQDARAATTSARGGVAVGGGGAGGDGFALTQLVNPHGYGGNLSPGGGGGTYGRFRIYVPAGTTPSLSPAEASPAFDPHAVVPIQ